MPECPYAWQDHGLHSGGRGCHEERVADVAAREQTARRSSTERAKVSVVREILIYLSRQISVFRRGESFAHFSKQICHQSFSWFGDIYLQSELVFLRC